MFAAGNAAVEHAQQLCAAPGQDEVLAIAAFALRTRLDEAVIQQARFVAGRLGAQVVEVGCCSQALLIGQVLRVLARSEGFAGAVLRLMQQAFDQIPIVRLGGVSSSDGLNESDCAGR